MACQTASALLSNADDKREKEGNSAPHLHVLIAERVFVALAVVCLSLGHAGRYGVDVHPVSVPLVRVKPHPCTTQSALLLFIEGLR